MGQINRRTLLAAAAALACASPAVAQSSLTPPGEASRFIQQIGKELPAVISGARSDSDKRQRIVIFLERVADLDHIAQFCLGRFWRIATPEQQAEYRQLFVQALAAAIAIRVDIYKSGTSDIRFLTELPGPNGTTVRTVVSSPGQSSVQVDWLVDTYRTPFHVVDVSAEGVSARLTLRSDYNAFLTQNGGNIPLFLQTLRAHLN